MEMSVVTLRELGYKKIGSMIDKDFMQKMGLVALALSGMKMSPYKFLTFWDTIRDSKNEEIKLMLDWCLDLNTSLENTDKIEITDKNRFKHAYKQLITKFCEANNITDIVEQRLFSEVGLCLPYALAFIDDNNDETLRKLVKGINKDRESDIYAVNQLYKTLYSWLIITSSQDLKDNKHLLRLLDTLVLTSNEDFCNMLMSDERGNLLESSKAGNRVL